MGNQSNVRNKLIWTFVVGIAVGAAASYLSKKSNREDLKESYEHGKDYVKKQAGQMKNKLADESEDLLDLAASKMDELSRMLEQKAQEMHKKSKEIES